MNDHLPSADDIREAWIAWSAGERVPTKGREQSGNEFDLWKFEYSAEQYSSGFVAAQRICEGDFVEIPIDEVKNA